MAQKTAGETTGGANAALAQSIAGVAENYDALPYQSKPILRAHPARLAGAARLFGLDAPPLDQARVLELGCAAGGNLIPLAAFYPRAQFLGIDLGARMIADGQARVARLGLENIALRQQSITDFGEADGQFDYIICHGVYSWVPAEVRQAILAICARSLSPHGLAYISYNVLPGWRMLQPLRDAMRLMIPPSPDAVTRARQGRKLLDYLAAMTPDDGVYGALLRGAPGNYAENSDDYLYHEFMEDVNEPCAFADFVRAAGDHGLSYLGESELSDMFAHRFGADFAEKLDRTTSDFVASQEMLDILTGAIFRASIVMRSDRAPQINRAIGPRSFAALHLVASPFHELRVEDNTIVIASRQGDCETIPLCPETAYLLRLFAAPPTTLPFAACFPRLESEDLSRAMSMLLQLAAQGVVGVSAQPLQGAPTGERPVATRLAQDDALSGAKFTANRLHHAIEIGDLPRFLLPLLDGTRSAEDCVALLLDAARAGVVRLQEADGALAEGDRAQELAAMLVAGGLDSIAACGLLEL